MFLINHTSAPIRKERLSPTSKARKEASQNEFMVQGGKPDRVKSFREINSVDRPGWKPVCRGERMELNSRKKSRRGRMMRSKSFDTQEVREIDRKEAGESRGFPILWKGIMEDLFQMEEKECEVQERLKM